MVVHEWGTFTTLSTSSGVPLSGLYHDASRLPSFVYGLPFFNYDSITGWPNPANLQNVTVKMETPVLYFYSSSHRNVEVTVGFKGGTINQWFPQRSAGETNPTGHLDMALPYDGQIKWSIQVLAPSSLAHVSTIPAFETHEWTAPRNTGSNLVRTQNGDVEKFLFYRGLGNFELPVKLKFNSDGRLEVSNLGSVNVSYILIFETAGDSLAETVRETSSLQPSIWWGGAIKCGAKSLCEKSPR